MYPFSISARRHDAGAPQIGQVPRNLGLRLLQNLDKVTNADFLRTHEIEQPQPSVVPKGLKEALHVEGFLPARHKKSIYVLTDVSTGNIVGLADM
jgi:hypothetical protein